MVVEQLHLGPPVAVDGAHVLPVAVEPVAEHARATLEHGGDDVGAEVGPVLGEPVEQRPLGEDVDAQAGQVALGLLGLLLPLHDLVVVVQGQDAEAMRLTERHLLDRDGHVGPLPAVLLDEGP